MQLLQKTTPTNPLGNDDRKIDYRHSMGTLDIYVLNPVLFLRTQVIICLCV